MASLAGAGAALALLSMPVGLLEMIASSVGLSEILPAAAPPLGLKARGLMAIFLGLMAFGLAAALGRETKRANARTENQGRATRAAGGSIMGFALSKLTALARGRAGPVKTPIRAVASTSDEQAAPALRRADAHPDAPARAPIFASRDFGGLDIFPRLKAEESAQAVLSHGFSEESEALGDAAPGLPMSAASAALAGTALRGPFDAVPDAGLDIGAAPITLPAELTTDLAEPEAKTLLSVDTGRSDRPTGELSLTELTDRLERGLRARNEARQARAVHALPAADDADATAPVLAAIPPAEPVPVRASVADEVDGALRAALGTLRGLTGRSR